MKKNGVIISATVGVLVIVMSGMWYYHKIMEVRTAQELLADFQSPSVGTRERAEARMAELKSDAIIAGLIELMENGEYEQRAIRVLAKIGEPAIDALIRKLVFEDTAASGNTSLLSQIGIFQGGGKSPGIQEGAGKALMSIGGPAVDGLLRNLERGNDETRAYCVRLLGKIGDNRALEPLIAALNDNYPPVRWNTLAALAYFDDESAYQATRGGLKDEDERVRLTAVWGMANKPQNDFFGNGMDERIFDDILGVTTDEDAKVRAMALSVVYQFEDDRSIEAAAVALNDRVMGIRRDAAKMLGRHKDRRGVDMLIEMLRTSNGRELEQVATMLGDIGDPKAVRPLIAVVNGQDPARGAAVEALAKFNDQRGKDVILKTLESTDAKVRKCSAYAFELMRDDRAVEPLVKMIRTDPDEPVRRAATWAMETYDTAEATGALIAAYSDESPEVRYASVRLLGFRKGPDIMELLLKALKDESSKIRSEATHALFAFPDERAVSAICEMMHSDDVDVRKQAAAAFRHSKDERGVDALLFALNDEDTVVRQNAAMALAAIKSPRAVEPLVKAWESSDKYVKSCIVMALAKIEGPEADAALAQVTGGADLTEVAVTRKKYISEGSDSNMVLLTAALGATDDMQLAEALYWANKDQLRWFSEAWGEMTGNIRQLRASVDNGSRQRWPKVVKTAAQRQFDMYYAGMDSAEAKKRRQAVARLGMRLSEYFAPEAALEQAEDEMYIEEQLFGADEGWDVSRLPSEMVDADVNEELYQIEGERIKALHEELTAQDIAFAIGRLTTALKDENGQVRGTAARAIAQVGNNSVLESLSDALLDENISLRCTAASCLGHVKTEESVMVLTEALKQDIAQVRLAAIWALGDIRLPSTYDPLIAGLSDSDNGVREAAVANLAMLGDRRAVEHLLPLLNEDSPRLLVPVVLALKFMGTREAMDAIKARTAGINMEKVTTEYSQCISEGNDDLVEALIIALALNGNGWMASEYYWSGNKDLQQAAESWEDMTYRLAEPGAVYNGWDIDRESDDPSFSKWPGGTPPEPVKRKTPQKGGD